MKLHLIMLNLMEFEFLMEVSVGINSSRSVWKWLSSYTLQVTCIVQAEGWGSRTLLTRKITKKSQFKGLSSYLWKICSSPTTIKSEEISQISERIDFGTRRWRLSTQWMKRLYKRYMHTMLRWIGVRTANLTMLTSWQFKSAFNCSSSTHLCN